MANWRFASCFSLLVSLLFVGGLMFLGGCGPYGIYDGDDIATYLDSRCNKECQQQAWANLQKKAGDSIPEWSALLESKRGYQPIARDEDKLQEFSKRSEVLGVLMTLEIHRLAETVADWRKVSYSFSDRYACFRCAISDEESCVIVLASIEQLTKTGRDWVDSLTVRERLCVNQAPATFKEILLQAMSRIVTWPMSLDDHLYTYEAASHVSDPTTRRFLRQFAVTGLARPENFTAEKLEPLEIGQLWTLAVCATESEQEQIVLKAILQKSKSTVDHTVAVFNGAFHRGLTVPDTAWQDLEMLMTGSGLDQWFRVYAYSTEDSPLANFALKKIIELSTSAEQPAK